MAKKFDLNDDTVAVVIGSGAGGGTLSNELAQKGINVVCLEAGKRYTTDDIDLPLCLQANTILNLLSLNCLNIFSWYSYKLKGTNPSSRDIIFTYLRAKYDGSSKHFLYSSISSLVKEVSTPSLFTFGLPKYPNSLFLTANISSFTVITEQERILVFDIRKSFIHYLKLTDR